MKENESRSRIRRKRKREERQRNNWRTRKENYDGHCRRTDIVRGRIEEKSEVMALGVEFVSAF